MERTMAALLWRLRCGVDVPRAETMQLLRGVHCYVRDRCFVFRSQMWLLLKRFRDHHVRVVSGSEMVASDCRFDHYFEGWSCERFAPFNDGHAEFSMVRGRDDYVWFFN